jgi:hypothetical protein
VLGVARSELDALVFADLVSRGRARLTAPGEEASAVRDLGEALRLWRGDPYADWPQAAFAEPERHRLDELRAAAVTGRIEARLALGEAVDVVPELEEHVAAEPLREDWWRLLMLARYRAGRQSDALAAGRRARALLSAELGCPPGPALRSMEAAILAQDPALDAPRRSTALVPRAPGHLVVAPRPARTGVADRRAPGPDACRRGCAERADEGRGCAERADAERLRAEREAAAAEHSRRLAVVLAVALVLALVAAVIATVVAVRTVP